MSEAEKQEGQKTVVAFITGLLIGGLLVWVFSSSPTQAPTADEQKNDDKAEVTTTEGAKTESKEEVTATTEVAKKIEVAAEGVLKVNDQKAGNTVVVDSIAYPTTAGWVVVRDLKNDTVGNVLGAARYNTTDGLEAKNVPLMRDTVAGQSYAVFFFSEDGDNNFDMKKDTVMDGIRSTFTAQ